MPNQDGDGDRRWPGGVDSLGDSERQELIHSMASTRPRIEIDEALRRGWLEMWYQPKIDLRRKCLAGAEALARIRHPTFGILLPASFLPNISEASIARLTEHAIIATLRNWSRFDDAGFNLHLAINVPVSTLFKVPIPELVEEHRPKVDRWPGIILEVQEDQIVRDIKAVHDIAAKLKESSITLAIDDFGAGFSSFSSLRELSFAELKLDRGFVKNCATDPTNAAICQTAIDLAHRFGSAAVAEGLESMADLSALTVMGCDFGQGVLISPPMPPERFVDLLRSRMNKPAAAPAPAADLDEMGPDAVGQVA